MNKHEVFQNYQLEIARAELVRKYRASSNTWPDGIESKADPWYTFHQDKWFDAYVASLLGKPSLDPLGDALRWAKATDIPYPSWP
jgi:hypothetical protein